MGPRLVTRLHFYKDRNHNQLLDRTLSSRHILEIIRKEAITMWYWTDKVFRDLIWEWLRISAASRTDVVELQKTLLGLVNDTGSDTSDAQKRILDELGEHCGKVYKEFIRAGYRHLQTIRKFSNWSDVVVFNGELLNE